MRKKTNDENSNKYPCEKYVKFVKSLCGKYSPWEIWNDFINLFAISLNNSVRHEYWEEREKQYLQIVRKYTSEEQNKMTELSAMLINDMSNNADYDYLGKVYMDLRINCNEKGQFFTPYHISKLMAKLADGDSLEEPIIINEPTCGSGTCNVRRAAVGVAFSNGRPAVLIGRYLIASFCVNYHSIMFCCSFHNRVRGNFIIQNHRCPALRFSL